MDDGLWGGGLKWNADMMEIPHQDGLPWIMFYDGYERATFRMKLMEPGMAIPSEVEEAIDLHKDACSRTVGSITRKRRSSSTRT